MTDEPEVEASVVAEDGAHDRSRSTLPVMDPDEPLDPVDPDSSAPEHPGTATEDTPGEPSAAAGTETAAGAAPTNDDVDLDGLIPTDDGDPDDDPVAPLVMRGSAELVDQIEHVSDPDDGWAEQRAAAGTETAFHAEVEE